MIKQVLAQDYTQRLIEGNIVRLKLSRLRSHGLRLTRLRLYRLKFMRLKPIGSGTRGWRSGGGMGVQRNYILLYES